MKVANKHALIVPLYGDLEAECLERLSSWFQQGFWVVAVNNNPVGSSVEGVVANTFVHHHNRQGLAGGFNAGVDIAIENGANCITLLDQDSDISTSSLKKLAEACGPEIVVGPRIIDKNRATDHMKTQGNVRMLISSGTTFVPGMWSKIGGFRSWMEIDYIDHEWCSRARKLGVKLLSIDEAILIQTFGSPHPNYLAHILGMQLYSPYRRAIALRNLRWLLFQSYVPLDIRLKELIKMIFKPFVWLVLEPNRSHCLTVIWLGLTSPLYKPFPRRQLEAMR